MPAAVVTQAIRALTRATMMRRLSTASRAKSHTEVLAFTQRVMVFKISPTYIAISAAVRNGHTGGTTPTGGTSGSMTTNATTPMKPIAKFLVRLWNLAFGSRSMFRVESNTTRITRAAPNRASARTPWMNAPASRAPTRTALKVMVVDSHGFCGLVGLSRISRIRDEDWARKIACGAKTLITTRSRAPGTIALLKSTFPGTGSMPTTRTTARATSVEASPTAI